MVERIVSVNSRTFRIVRIIFAAMFLAALAFGTHVPATKAADLCVDPTAGDPHGCGYTTIQAAINAAKDTDVITVYPGTYAENLIIDKSITLQGSDQNGQDPDDRPVLVPAVSNPNPDCGTPFCNSTAPNDGGSSNLILIHAPEPTDPALPRILSKVTIQYMILDGENTNLTHDNTSPQVGGHYIDARNGIITDTMISASYNEVNINHVDVKNTYRSALYDGSYGSGSSFTDNNISNVAGPDANAIGIFTYGANNSTISRNTVDGATDAIAVYHSRGSTIQDNTITNTSLAIASFYAGFDGQPVADSISGNDVTCGLYGSGIVFIQDKLAPLATGNTVKNCAVSLWVRGGHATFTNNEVEGAGAGARGVVVTTDMGYAGEGGASSEDVYATFTGNAFSNVEDVFQAQAQQTAATETDPAIPYTVHLTMHTNSIVGTGNGLVETGLPGEGVYDIDATGNWWNSASGPQSTNNPGGAGMTLPGNLAAAVFSPWLCSGTDTSTAVGFQPDTANQCAVPTMLVFSTNPSGALSGLPFTTQPVVRAVDAGGNLGINFNGNMTLSIANGPVGAALSGTKTVKATNGQASFSGLAIDTIGTGYVLGAEAAFNGGTITGSSNPFAVGSSVPTPTVTGFDTTDATPNNAAAFTLTVNGQDFVNGAAVYWNGTKLTTTFVSSSKLTATVPAHSILAADEVLVTVKNPTNDTASTPVKYLGISLGPNGLVIKADKTTGKLTVTISKAQTGSVTIKLASSNTKVVVVPATVTIPAGQNSVDVTLTKIGPSNATITATLPAGLGNGSTSAKVTGEVPFFLPLIRR